MIALLKFWPVLLAIGCLGTGGVIGYRQAIKDTPPVVCPSCNCPVCPPQTNGVSLDDLRKFRGTLQVTQNYKVDVKGDSLLLSKFDLMLEKRLKELKLSRCK